MWTYKIIYHRKVRNVFSEMRNVYKRLVGISICDRRKAFAMFEFLTARLQKTQVLSDMTLRWVIDYRSFDVPSSSGSSSSRKI